MSEKEMKELNKRLVANLPENRIKMMQIEMEMRKQTQLSKLKQRKDHYGKKIKENVVSYKSKSGLDKTFNNESISSNNLNNSEI